MPNLYLIKRGPKPDYHKAPFHPVIICAEKRLAKWEAGSTGDGAWVWEKESWTENHQGWLLCRWNGFDIDFGHVVHSIAMPDGTKAGFWRDYDNELSVKDLFPSAVWWSKRRMPEWLQGRGVVYAPDSFTQQHILDHTADDGSSGFGRALPSYWPQVITT